MFLVIVKHRSRDLQLVQTSRQEDLSVGVMMLDIGFTFWSNLEHASFTRCLGRRF